MTISVIPTLSEFSKPQAGRGEKAREDPHSDKTEQHRRYMIQITGRKVKKHHCCSQKIPTGNAKVCRLQHIGSHYDRDPFLLPDESGQWMSRLRYAYEQTY